MTVFERVVTVEVMTFLFIEFYFCGMQQIYLHVLRSFFSSTTFVLTILINKKEVLCHIINVENKDESCLTT
jgi:hypothetical protein